MSNIKWTTQEYGSYKGLSSNQRHLTASVGGGTNSVSSFLFEAIENFDNVQATAGAEGPSAEYYCNASAGWYNGGKGVGWCGGATVGKATTHGYTGGPCAYRADDSGTGRVAGACIGARVITGRAEAKWNLFGVEVEGPAAAVVAYARNIPWSPIAEAGVMGEISAVKASLSMGLVFATASLNVNTGARIGTTGAEFNFLGWGASIGAKTSINSPYGSIGFKF